MRRYCDKLLALSGGSDFWRDTLARFLALSSERSRRGAIVRTRRYGFGGIEAAFPVVKLSDR